MDIPKCNACGAPLQPGDIQTPTLCLCAACEERESEAAQELYEKNSGVHQPPDQDPEDEEEPPVLDRDRPYEYLEEDQEEEEQTYHCAGCGRPVGRDDYDGMETYVCDACDELAQEDPFYYHS